jgi:hypothetical protein
MTYFPFLIFLFLLHNFRHRLLIQCLPWNCSLFADLYSWGSFLLSLGMGGLMVWLYHSTLSLSVVHIFPVTHFLYFQKLALQHVFEKEVVWYKVGDRTEKTAHFFIACKANPATRLSIPAAMRAKGFGCQSQSHRLNPCPAGVPQLPNKLS